MSSKAKNSSSSSKATNKHRKSSTTSKANDGDGGGIVDERFAAAITRPQFHKAKRSGSSGGGGGGGSSNHQRNTQDDDLDGSLTLGSGSSSGGGGGLGESLTAAIRSDDRFSAALLDSDKFGCVPDRDKYGRKTTKKDKKKKKKKERDDRGSGEDNNEEEGDTENDREESLNEDINVGKRSKSNIDKQDGQNVDNSMEARIAYLNALSRGDISGSSSSDDSSADSDDDESEDHDSDDDTSIQGTSGIFDPSHKSYLPGNDGNTSEGDDEDEETDEPSPYLCILNLNWEHIRAVDVYAMLHSFCPPGTLKKVEVYPSDFGREQMEKERVEGPPVGIWKNREKKEEEKEQQRRVRLDESDEEEDEDASGNNSDGIPSDDEDSDDNNRDDRPTNSSDNDDLENDDDDDVDEDEEEDDDEDVLDLNDATSKLYSHFPPQSAVMKNSKRQHDQEEEDGFDIEKLREYEASKLRYYFAIASFSTCDAASQVYDTVDGMEMEDSAAEIDVRVLPSNQYQCTIQDRAVRDACDRLPAKYTPPENATATALRQSRVTCSWERGDADRERKLNYGMGKDAWEALATGEDLKLYLATSDNSSCSSDGDSEDEHDMDDELESRMKENARKKKGSSTRRMLGLATSDSEEENDDASKSLDSVCSSDDSSSDCSDNKKNKIRGSYPNETESESKSISAAADIDELIHTNEVAFVPGKQNLDEKIREKIAQSTIINSGVSVDVVNRREELSPFQKYLQKRKEKKKERRQASRRAGKNDGGRNLDDGNEVNNDDMYGIDPEFGLAQFSDEEPGASGDAVGDNRHDDDGFFLDDSSVRSSPTMNLNGGGSDKVASSREELELLLAGDDGVFTVRSSLSPVSLIL